MALTIRELGARIRARRRELGLSQADLARAIGVSRWWVIQLETGKAMSAGLGPLLALLDRLELGLEIVPVANERAREGSFDLDAIIEELRE